MQGLFEYILRNPGPFVTFVSAVVALVSAMLARRETGRQRALMTESLRQQIDRASLEWGRETIDMMARAETLAEHPATETFEADKRHIAQMLSSLADRGRMFFPNLNPDKKGAEKEGAFRGIRPPILDALVFSHFEMASLEPGNAESVAFLNRCRRLIVSELQAHLDPRSLDQIVARYDRQRRTHREDALKRASTLRAELESRRPHVLDRAPHQRDDPE